MTMRIAGMLILLLLALTAHGHAEAFGGEAEGRWHRGRYDRAAESR